MGYKLEEAIIAIERLGVFCFHLYIGVGYWLVISAKNERIIVLYICYLYESLANFYWS